MLIYFYMDITQAISTISSLCVSGRSIFGSGYSLLWSAMLWLGFWRRLLLIITIIAWVVYEIFSKGTHKRKTENGFTPMFNRFIGASGYFCFQTIIYFGLKLIFTDAIYCFKWPYALHSIVFLLNGFILHMIGIWPYWRVFGEKIRIR